ncbi:NAD(P)/FAD-dependent oxidoreductase [Primorskyibacter flagellatus]|uniref:NAD(P)/FAD-dependent oxidoreductase n=1 Tax=Primorskyibacter flagellatus TaxID=1387277 RepID=UPI003A910E1D
MDLLFSNDRRGTYPASWYAATATPLAPFAPLRGEVRADVCVVGGGYTGLSAALHLAQAGRSVVLIEAHRVGFGASGRNGGQLGSGQRLTQDGLEKLMGDGPAHALWDLAEDAKALVKDLIARHGIACDLTPGVGWAGTSQRSVDGLHRYAEHLAARYGYEEIDALRTNDWQAICRAPQHLGAILDHGAAHLHPLKLALGLAQAAHDAGVQIHETSHVHHLIQGTPATVQTESGRVIAEQVILACNGYLGGLNRKVAARVMPINNFIAATEPLGDGAAEVLARNVAVADDRFVVNYFRMSHDGRLLFGGGESYGYKFPADIAALVRKPMEQSFPQLKGVRIDHAWGGTLAITMRRMPYLARVAPNILSASGYSGHGVGTAVHAGQLMARAIEGQTDGFDTMAAVPAQPFPGGAMMRNPLLALAMSWYALRDRLGV